MPLLKATGLTIILPGAPVAPAAPGATQLLNVPYFRQEQTNWCWAACCEMVFHYYGDAGIRQCDMATAQFGGDCCTAPASYGCNQGNWPEYTYAHYSFTNTKIASSITFGTITSEIDVSPTGRPVEVYYAWSGGGAHVALIRGYYDNGDLEVSDPWYGPGRKTYNNVLTGYGMGSWTITYTNLRK